MSTTTAPVTGIQSNDVKEMLSAQSTQFKGMMDGISSTFVSLFQSLSNSNSANFAALSKQSEVFSNKIFSDGNTNTNMMGQMASMMKSSNDTLASTMYALQSNRLMYSWANPGSGSSSVSNQTINTNYAN